MAHIIINPSLSTAIAYNLFFNPPKFAEVSTILEPENSTQTDYSTIIIVCSPNTVIIMRAKVFSIKIFQYFRQIPPRVCTLVLFIICWFDGFESSLVVLLFSLLQKMMVGFHCSYLEQFLLQ